MPNELEGRLDPVGFEIYGERTIRGRRDDKGEAAAKADNEAKEKEATDKTDSQIRSHTGKKSNLALGDNFSSVISSSRTQKLRKSKTRRIFFVKTKLLRSNDNRQMKASQQSLHQTILIRNWMADNNSKPDIVVPTKREQDLVSATLSANEDHFEMEETLTSDSGKDAPTINDNDFKVDGAYISQFDADAPSISDDNIKTDETFTSGFDIEALSGNDEDLKMEGTFTSHSYKDKEIDMTQTELLLVETPAEQMARMAEYRSIDIVLELLGASNVRDERPPYF